jgi:dihydrodipicolinate synthase/N-acetylneuraminate lyase
LSQPIGARRFPACILATVVAPWTAEYRLDEALFRFEIASLLAAGYSHLYVFGTAGEGYAVSEAQFEQVASVFVEEMRSGGAEPMVGVISLSLETMLQRIAFARHSLGVRHFQISLPSWGALETAEVRAFFDVVLGRYPDCDFLHYNLLRTKRLVTAEEYALIAADHPNLVATKNSTDSMLRIRDLIEKAPTVQHFLNEHGFVYGSLVGECGLLISLGTLNLIMGQRYFAAGQQHDLSALLRMETELTRLGEKFHECVSGGRTLIDGAYDKVLWWLHDNRFPLRMLPPYQGATPAGAGAFAKFVRDNYPAWVA